MWHFATEGPCSLSVCLVPWLYELPAWFGVSQCPFYFSLYKVRGLGNASIKISCIALLRNLSSVSDVLFPVLHFRITPLMTS